MTRGRFPGRLLRACALLLALPVTAAPAHAQYFSLEQAGAADSVLVGEVVTFRARVHIGIQQSLASFVPVLVGELPEGVRLVAVDTLRPEGKRTTLVGDVRLAFYRPGRHQVPVLRLILKHVASDRGRPLEPEPVWVDVGSTLSPGNPALRDIRDDLPQPPLSPLAWVAAGLVGALALLLWRYWRARRARRTDGTMTSPAVVGASTPLQRAQAALDRLAAESWPDTASYYAGVTDVLRGYFTEMEPAVRTSQTSREILAVLARANGNGAWTGTERILGAADLVKFAGRVPSPDTTRAWASDVRSLLTTWDPLLLSRLTTHDSRLA